MFVRDPVSRLWDRAAAQLLYRARTARGGWEGTRIADPTAAQRAWLARLDINPDGRDTSSAIGGRAQAGNGLDCKSRWARGFARAVYYINEPANGGPGLALELEFGARKPALGVIPAGRAVRLRVRKGGGVARRALEAKPDTARIFDSAGYPAGRWSDPDKRDWS